MVSFVNKTLIELLSIRKILFNSIFRNKAVNVVLRVRRIPPELQVLFATLGVKFPGGKSASYQEIISGNLSQKHRILPENIDIVQNINTSQCICIKEFKFVDRIDEEANVRF